MDGLSFEQWVLFLAVRFRDRYRACSAQSFPELAPRLPLARGGKLTVVQVNGGEAVHFIYTGTAAREPTAARALTVRPPEGLAVRDWALLHGEGYKRFVERTLGLASIGHFLVFPGDGDAEQAAVEAADLAVREHAAGMDPGQSGFR